MNPTLMRLYCTLLALSVWFLPEKAHACGYAYISDCATQMDLEVNGSTSTYRVSNCPYLSVFNNANFGSVSSLSITKLRSQTWESCDNNVMNARFNYRIHLQSASPGTFTSLNLTQLNTVTNGAYRNKTREEFPNLNLLAGLNPGNYYIEVWFQSDVDFDNNGTVNAMLTADNGGIYYKASFTVPSNQGGNLAITLVNKTNVLCNGGNTGSATVNVTTGTAPYAYLWSSGQTTQNVTGLTAGNYIVSASDAGGNSGTLNVSISQPATLFANLTGVDETSAPANNGSATAAPSGGTPVYNYAWSNSATTATINNLNSGSYSCTVTDANGCAASGSVIISVSGANPTNYCASLGSQPWVDWITRVNLNTINKTSGKTQYSNFTTTNSTDLNTGTTYAITLENGFSWQTYNEHWKVWIDFNRNGIFEEPSEIAFSGILPAPPLGSPGGVTNGSITVPASADLGLTRMRVSLKRGAYATPCETIPFGEVEDYTINLTSGGPVQCSITSGISNMSCSDNGTATITTDDTYTFSLTVNGNGTSASWQATIAGQAQTGSYGVPKTIGPLPISGGALNFTIRDATDISCTVAQSVTPPQPCSNVNPCAISATISNIACNNNGTAADPADDTFTFNVLVTGSGTGSGWTTTVLGTPVTGTYGQVKQLGPYAISGGILNFTIADAATASCNTVKSVTPPATCSNGGGGGPSYCASSSAFPWHDWISGVSVGTINNPSNKTPYSDFTGLSTTLQKGQSYPVVLSAGFSWFTYTEHWKVWIDYDKDGLFEEPEELAFSAVQTMPPLGTLEATVNGTITIPNTAASGTTRMRVAMKRGAAPTPCETLPNGEVEDYTVNLAIGANGGETGERALAAQMDARPTLDAIQLYAVLETMPGASFWLLEKSTDGEFFTPFSDDAIDDGEDFLVVEQKDADPAEGENFYRITLFDGQGNPLRQASANAEFKPIEAFAVFPNPAANEFFVELSKAQGKAVRLEVMNRQGVILHREVLDEVSEPFHRIPLNGWQEGLYFVFIQAEGKKAVSKRLVVVRP